MVALACPAAGRQLKVDGGVPSNPNTTPGPVANPEATLRNIGATISGLIYNELRGESCSPPPPPRLFAVSLSQEPVVVPSLCCPLQPRQHTLPTFPTRSAATLGLSGRRRGYRTAASPRCICPATGDRPAIGSATLEIYDLVATWNREWKYPHLTTLRRQGSRCAQCPSCLLKCDPPRA